ncbi:MAG: type II toxin-antitoxin system ParD family antitoxin [Mariprofundales bacterium]|nr:type II toxin-antitoxin system ParD family antitoxin [Mariprofundales bacterium]
MNLNLTPNLESFVRKRAKSGDYNNASEVVRDALRLLKRTEDSHQLKLQRLRMSIEEGDIAIQRGDATILDSIEDLDIFFEAL